MAWTSPMTFTPNTVLTAAQMNTHLRDNLLETAPAKATTSGSLFFGDGPNRIAERIPKRGYVGTGETVKDTEYRNLSTAGPKVSLITGDKALIFLSAAIASAAVDQSSYMSYQVTGATNIDPSDDKALMVEGVSTVGYNQWCQAIVETELKPGFNTFTTKYKAGSTSNTSTFFYRTISVIPF